MKRNTVIYIAISLLAGCHALQQPPARVVLPSGSPTLPRAAGEVDLLLVEANRLAKKVGSGELTRVAAADQLNAYRIRIIGRNSVDDANFASYRYVTAERDADRMTQEEARARMEIALRECTRRWPSLNAKPSNPAFTNFLMKMYGLPPLSD